MPKSSSRPAASVVRKPSLNTIAKATGLSINAISDIINRNRANLYRTETVERVTEVARKLKYRPNRAAKMLLTNQSNTIGFVTMSVGLEQDVANHVVYPFIIGANSAFGAKGYHITLVDIKELRDENGATLLPRLLQDQFCDGFILQKGRWGDIQEWIDRSLLPIILWDAGIFKAHNCIYRDEYQVGWMLAKQLISLGHRAIAFVTTRQDWERLQSRRAMDDLGERVRARGLVGLNLSDDDFHYSSVLRYEGMLAAAHEHGLPLDVIIRGTLTELIRDLREKSPTALILEGGYNVDLQIARAADALGWTIPERLSVAYCDLDIKAYHDAQLLMAGGITYDRYQAGGMAADLMFRALASPGGKLPSIKLVGEFVRGESIAPAPAL